MKTTNANIKRYKEQVMTRGKKKDDDRLEKYGKSGGDTKSGKSGKSGGDDTVKRPADTLAAADENL